MIQVSGYFYDATTRQKIGERGNYTIACMAGYSYNISEALVHMQVLEEFTDIQHWAATQYLLNSQPGSVGLDYSVPLPDIGLGPIQLPISGTYSIDSFSYDYNNILYWLKIYYEGILSRSGEMHDIRFCRSDDPDKLFIEYNYQKYPNGLCLNDGSSTGYIDNIRTFPKQAAPHPVGYAPNAFLFLYATNVLDVDPDSGVQFYIGCFNMNDSEVMGSVYKGSFASLNTLSTTAPRIDGIKDPFFKVKYNLTGSRTCEASFYNIESVSDCYVIPYQSKYPMSGATLDYGVLIVSGSTIPAVFRRKQTTPSSGTTIAGFTSDTVISGIHCVWSAMGWPRSQINSVTIETNLYPPVFDLGTSPNTNYIADNWNYIANSYSIQIVSTSPSSRSATYKYLSYMEVPESEVEPTVIPPADEPTDPAQPDIQDPYYDPTSDPKSPQYDPTKDPTSPSYDPSTPHTPYRPVSQPEYHEPPVQPPQDDIELPPTPPSYITNNKMFTLYNPSGGDLNNVATFLWSSGWSVDAFKKIFANPIQCILGLMVLPQLAATVSSKELTFGNVPSGITLYYFDSQFFDFDCGSFDVKEYYASYLDYAPYTKVSIFLPFVGDHELDTDEVMNKTISVKYRFDLATGDCVAFIFVGSSVHYQFSGNCAARLPIGGSSSNALSSLFSLFSMAASVPAGLPALGAASAIAVTSMKQKISHSGSISGSAGLMGVLTPYLIITRPRQAYPMNQNIFTGYPSFVTESLSQLTGYTEVEQVHLEHIPATGEELVELERLLKEGVLF